MIRDADSNQSNCYAYQNNNPGWNPLQEFLGLAPDEEEQPIANSTFKENKFTCHCEFDYCLGDAGGIENSTVSTSYFSQTILLAAILTRTCLVLEQPATALARVHGPAVLLGSPRGFKL